ncbi:MAG: maleylpyruvate isomerase N-terminal domain-containing protein [Acidobacteriota bacterium]
MAEVGSIGAVLQREWHELLASLVPARERSPLVLPPARRMPFRPAALFAELEEVRFAWSELRSLALDEHADRYVNPEWTVKDLLAHLASWAREFRSQVETAFRGESFDYAIPYALSVVGPNQWNQKEVAQRRGRSLDEILDEFDAETARLQDLVLEMPEQGLSAERSFPMAPSGDPDVTVRSTCAMQVLGKCRHDRYHIGQMRSWLAALRTNK